ncbi:MAG: pentapeptide repeat-containing protein [Nocardioides sp.]|nr:pentapeptide repeat-containing protein [Nocardioides sp.]
MGPISAARHTVERSRRLDPELLHESVDGSGRSSRRCATWCSPPDADTEPVDGVGWPEPRSYPVRECLLIVLNEEWEHRLYAERDLDALEARNA